MSDDDTQIIHALREWGPDVGDPPEAKTRDYIHPDLEQQVMEAIARYPQSRTLPDGKIHGLAAVAAVLVVEKWLLDRAQNDPSRPRSEDQAYE